eukprot:5500353-Prymnesium_polylepis.2
MSEPEGERRASSGCGNRSFVFTVSVAVTKTLRDKLLDRISNSVDPAVSGSGRLGLGSGAVLLLVGASVGGATRPACRAVLLWVWRGAPPRPGAAAGGLAQRPRVRVAAKHKAGRRQPLGSRISASTALSSR